MPTTKLVAHCAWLLNDTSSQHTPLQKEEFQKIVDADARGDEEQVKQLTEQINEHFSKLNRNLSTSVEQLQLRRYVAYNIVNCILQEYAPSGVATNKDNDQLILSYGDTEHQLQVVAMHNSAVTLEDVANSKKRLEEVTFDELCLDHDHARKRFRATCKAENLIDGYLRACDWDGIKMLLDQDEEVYRRLIPWLSRLQTPSHPILEPANQVVTEQFRYYRAIADDRHEPAEPPPTYSVHDLNAPPGYPEPSLGLMGLMGLDSVVNRLRSTFSGGSDTA